MRPYCDLQSRRFATAAANAATAKKRRRFLALSDKWRIQSEETDEERQARLDAAVQVAKLAAACEALDRASKRLQPDYGIAARREARVQRKVADTEARRIKMAEREDRQAAKRLRDRDRARDKKQGGALPPLPY